MEKFFKPLALAMTLLLAFTITSCSVGDDDDDSSTNSLSKMQRSEQVANMAGTYSGRIYFSNDTTLSKDSIPCNWELTAADSTLKITNFPVSVFAMGITNANARKILLNGGVKELTGTILPYFNDYIQQGYYTFWFEPKDYQLSFNVDYEGASHAVKVDFTSQMYAYTNNGGPALFYCVGEYYNREIMAYILVKDVVVDGMTLTTGWSSYIYGKK